MLTVVVIARRVPRASRADWHRMAPGHERAWRNGGGPTRVGITHQRQRRRWHSGSSALPGVRSVFGIGSAVARSARAGVAHAESGDPDRHRQRVRLDSGTGIKSCLIEFMFCRLQVLTWTALILVSFDLPVKTAIGILSLTQHVSTIW